MDELGNSEDALQPPQSQQPPAPEQRGYEPPAYVRIAHEAKPSWARTTGQRRMFAIGAGAVAVLLVGTCIAVGVMASGNTSTSGSPLNGNSNASGAVAQAGPTYTPAQAGPTYTPAPTITPFPTPTPAPTITPTPVPQPKKVLDFIGNGIKTSKNFDVAGQSQTLTWKCDHSSFYGSDYNVQVYVYDASTHNLVQSMDALPVNAMCQSTYTGDSTQMYLDPGTYYIKMNSEGWWHVTITDNP